MKSNGLIRPLTVVAALLAALTSSGAALAEDVKLPVVDRKLYPMRLNPEFTVFGDYALATKYTTHVGGDVSFVYHLLDQLALEVHGGYLFGSESNIMKILRERSRQTRTRAPYSSSNPREPAVPGLQMLTYHLAADVQFAPIYGKLSFVSEVETTFQLYGLLGAGLAGTRTKTDSASPPLCSVVNTQFTPGCAQLYVGPQKLVDLPGIAFGDTDIFGPGRYQILPLAVPVEYGLGIRLMLNKWIGIRGELRNMHWLGVDLASDKTATPLDVHEPGNDSCTTGYTLEDPVADSIAGQLLGGATPCYLNLHTVSLARLGVSFIIPVNSFF